MKRLLSALLALSLAACADDALAPRDVYGRYRLVPGDLTSSYIGPDSVVILPTGSYRTIAVMVARAGSPAGALDSVAVMRSPFTFTFRGGEMQITYLCGPGAECFPGPHLFGTLDGDILTLRPPPVSSVSAQRYLRVSRD
jgi:hypothetical protein